MKYPRVVEILAQERRRIAGSYVAAQEMAKLLRAEGCEAADPNEQDANERIDALAKAEGLIGLIAGSDKLRQAVERAARRK